MAHHGDDVCGGSCVGRRRNFGTIPTVKILRSRRFFLPEPLERLSSSERREEVTWAKGHSVLFSAESCPQH
jgi:hypothetical protein